MPKYIFLQPDVVIIAFNFIISAIVIFKEPILKRVLNIAVQVKPLMQLIMIS